MSYRYVFCHQRRNVTNWPVSYYCSETKPGPHFAHGFFALYLPLFFHLTLQERGAKFILCSYIQVQHLTKCAAKQGFLPLVANSWVFWLHGFHSWTVCLFLQSLSLKPVADVAPARPAGGANNHEKRSKLIHHTHAMPIKMFLTGRQSCEILL